MVSKKISGVPLDKREKWGIIRGEKAKSKVVFWAISLMVEY
jgi:hypothetical protein